MLNKGAATIQSLLKRDEGFNDRLEADAHKDARLTRALAKTDIGALMFDKNRGAVQFRWYLSFRGKR